MPVKRRLRECGITIGIQPTGPHNAITDVAGVRVGHATVDIGEGALVPGKGPARTGVTAIMPAEGNVFLSKVSAGVHVINGWGKSIGLMQIAETGQIETPVLITNTLNVGRCADALIEYMLFDEKLDAVSINSAVTECNDSHLNDIAGRHVGPEHVRQAIRNARGGAVEQGAVGGGRGMICYQFKGGIGTASRLVEIGGETFTVGALVCANMGKKEDLRVDGVFVGRRLTEGPDPAEEVGSIIMLLATDAPLESRQLTRLAVRATHGLARTGTYSGHGSGDVVLAWSSTLRIPHKAPGPLVTEPRFLDGQISQLFRAAADATEEAILDAMWTAETVVGRDGNCYEAIPVDRVLEVMAANGYRFA